jgi:type 2 lantibiotic biosynthesis protein LanM
VVDSAKYLEVAEGLGARLCREAIWSDDQCNWTGDSMEFIESRLQVVNRACGPELYNGTSGIALFLSYLYACTKQNIFKKTALGAISFALSQLDQFAPATRFGFYTGLTGIAYVLAEAREILDEEQGIEQALELLKIIIQCEPERAQHFDVISGSAGVIPVLLKLHARYGEPFLLDAALRLGDCLLEAANRGQEEAQGWSWTTVPDAGMKDLTGFSHGVAGIAWALAELYNKFKEQRFLHGAQQALRYERRWFDPQQENWPDFRVVSESGEPGYTAAWCHGAPGIALSRLRCYQILRDRECLTEVQAAIRTTTRALNAAITSGEGNYSLCHGNCGNAELLISAADLLADGDSLKIVEQLADNAHEKYHLTRNPWPCGVLNGGETPNMMLGLAGIGYFYLRLADRKVPSVLLVVPEGS